MQRRKKKTKRKRKEPGRRRLKRWSAAKWLWKTLLSSGQLWHWRHEGSTLSTKPWSCFAWWKIGLFCLQCRAYTLWLLRYCAALGASSMKWSLQVRGRKSGVSGGSLGMVKGSQGWLETYWSLLERKIGKSCCWTVYVILERPRCGKLKSNLNKELLAGTCHCACKLLCNSQNVFVDASSSYFHFQNHDFLLNLVWFPLIWPSMWAKLFSSLSQTAQQFAPNCSAVCPKLLSSLVSSFTKVLTILFGFWKFSACFPWILKQNLVNSCSQSDFCCGCVWVLLLLWNFQTNMARLGVLANTVDMQLLP